MCQALRIAIAAVAVMAASCRTPLARCGAPPPGVPRLESYLDVQVPATYWLEMVFSENEWQPPEILPMPYHHATRLELIHGAELPSLSAHQSERLRFTVEITSREVRQISGRQEWRATYVARVVSVCVP